MSCHDIVKRMLQMHKSKSPSAVRIPDKILKDDVHFVSKPLALIYNAFLEKAIFPWLGNWPE